MAKSRNFKAKIEKQNSGQRYRGGNLPVPSVLDAVDIIKAGPVDGAFFSVSQELSAHECQKSPTTRYGAGKAINAICFVAILLQNASHVPNA